jgi:urea transport system permease protein
VTGAFPGRGFGPGEALECRGVFGRRGIRAVIARRLGGITVFAALLTAIGPASAQMPDDAFRSALSGLRGASYPEKEAIINTVAEGGHASIRDVLTAFLEDRLYIRATDGRVFVARTAEATEGSVTLLDPVSLEEAGKAAVDDLELVGTNNRLRRVLRTTVARFALSHPDAGVRLQAVTEMQRALDDATVDMLREQAARETDNAVKAEIDSALALAALDGADPAARLRAVETLRTRVKPDVRNRLAQLTESSDGTFVESDPEVRAAAAAAVAAIDNTLWWYSGVEMLFFGLSLGSILVLVAIGLAITFGVMGVINMAHGELMMLGAYTTYVVQLLMPQHIAVSVLVAIPAAFLVSGAAGVLLEISVIRRLYGRPLETLLATFGVSLVLQQLVRTLFTANNRAVETPAWMSGTLQIIEGLSITLNRVYILGFAMAVFAILLIVLRRTRLGLDIRAVAQNRGMARAMGIRSAWVDAMTFGLGSGIAGVAGVALSQLTNVGPDLGQSYIIDSFMVVVFGGVGNLWGTLIGGLSLGVVNKLLEPFAGAVLAKIFVLIGLILFIQRRPRGLFPQTGRAAEGL